LVEEFSILSCNNIQNIGRLHLISAAEKGIQISTIHRQKHSTVTASIFSVQHQNKQWFSD